MRPISSFALIALVALTSGVIAQTPPPTLEERMSQAEFNGAGLNKLSPEELQRLNGWLAAHGGTTTKVVNSSGEPVFYQDSGDRVAVEAHIEGLFQGWRGNTIFKLDNGQEWQQAESGVLDAGKFNNPAVKIKPMLLGSWLMYVEDCGCNIRVKRVR